MDEIIHGRKVRVGDFIRCRPPRQRSFLGVVKGFHYDDDRFVTSVDVWGGNNQRASMRTLWVGQVEPLSDREQARAIKKAQRGQ